MTENEDVIWLELQDDCIRMVKEDVPADKIVDHLRNVLFDKTGEVWQDDSGNEIGRRQMIRDIEGLKFRYTSALIQRLQGVN